MSKNVKMHSVRLPYQTEFKPIECIGKNCPHCENDKIKQLETIIKNRDTELDKLIEEKSKLKQQVLQLEQALKDLVELKNHKNKYGKDKYYTKMQPKLWFNAQRVLSMIKISRL